MKKYKKFQKNLDCKQGLYCITMLGGGQNGNKRG